MSIGEVLAGCGRSSRTSRSPRSGSWSPRAWSSRSARRRATASSATTTSSGCATCWPRSATTTCRCGSSGSTSTPWTAASSRRLARVPRRGCRMSLVADDGLPSAGVVRPRRRPSCGCRAPSCCDAAGSTEEQLVELESYGLVTAGRSASLRRRRPRRSPRRWPSWPRTASSRGTCGPFRTAADREVGLVEQVVAPLLRQRSPEAQARAEEVGARAARARPLRLHAALVQPAACRTGLSSSRGRRGPTARVGSRGRAASSTSSGSGSRCPRTSRSCCCARSGGDRYLPIWIGAGRGHGHRLRPAGRRAAAAADPRPVTRRARGRSAASCSRCASPSCATASSTPSWSSPAGSRSAPGRRTRSPWPCAPGPRSSAPRRCSTRRASPIPDEQEDEVEKFREFLDQISPGGLRAPAGAGGRQTGSEPSTLDSRSRVLRGMSTAAIVDVAGGSPSVTVPANADSLSVTGWCPSLIVATVRAHGFATRGSEVPDGRAADPTATGRHRAPRDGAPSTGQAPGRRAGPAVRRRPARRCPTTSATAARPPAPPPASPTASSTTGPAPAWSSRRVRTATGSGTQRLYCFRDILVLKVVKRLLDTGVSLQNIRTAVEHLRDRGVDDLAQITLMSDGASVYECTSADEVVDLRPGRPGRLRHRRRPGRGARSRARWPSCPASAPTACEPAPTLGTPATSWPRAAARTRRPADAPSVSVGSRDRAPRRTLPAASLSTPRGRVPRSQSGAPKEQPPRNLSGPRTARARHSGERRRPDWRAAAPTVQARDAGEALRSHDRAGAASRRAASGVAPRRRLRHDRPSSTSSRRAVRRPAHRPRRGRAGQDARRRRPRPPRRAGRRGGARVDPRPTRRWRCPPRPTEAEVLAELRELAAPQPASSRR